MAWTGSDWPSGSGLNDHRLLKGMLLRYILDPHICETAEATTLSHDASRLSDPAAKLSTGACAVQFARRS
jgi:hypothetical protein